MNSSKITTKCSNVFITFSLLLLVTIAIAESSPGHRPRFIAIPLEDVQLVEVEDIADSKVANGNAIVRVPRQVPTAPESENDPDAARFERQAGHQDHHHQYVDFGAHTGHHGSFGWYADFPVKDPGH